MGKKVMGYCRLCGNYKKLSKEHVPPSSAFNSGDYTVESIDQFKSIDVNVWREQKKQGRHFAYVFCEQCNNKTGFWYGSEYKKLAEACAPYAWTANAETIGLISLPEMYPLRVFKQALTIICAMIDPKPDNDDWGIVQSPSSSGLGLAKLDMDMSKAYKYLPALRNFVLDKEVSNLPVPVRLYTYLVCGYKGRTADVVRWFNKNTGASLLFSEFSWWPLGWVLVFDGRLEKDLFDVTEWAQYEYNDVFPVRLNVPCLWVEGRMPLSFESPEQMSLLRAKNQAAINARKEREEN